MAKKIYISEKQYKKLQEIIKEEEQGLEIPVDTTNTNVEDALAKAKENVTSALGQTIANKTNFTLKGDAVESKTFLKKTIEESRVNRIIKEGHTFSKKDFTKLMLNENVDLFWKALDILKACDGEIEVEEIAEEMGYTPNDAEWDMVMRAIDEAEEEYWQDNGNPQAWWGNH